MHANFTLKRTLQPTTAKNGTFSITLKRHNARKFNTSFSKADPVTFMLNNAKLNIMSEFNYTHNKTEGVIEVVTPYNQEFVKKCRNLRGKWDKVKSAWIFDDSIEEYVKQALMDCYGTTGEEIVEYCNLLVTDYSYFGSKGPVELFGRTIAKAWGRDSGAKLGDDIVWISGTYRSGGSVKNWGTDITDATFEIQNFPLPRTEFDDVKEAIAAGWCEIKMPKKKRTEEDIKADIEKYEAILQELRNELNNI